MNYRNQTTHLWHSLESSECEKIMRSSEHGLSETESQSRLAEYGPNELPKKPPPTLPAIFLRQFRSPLIYILGLAAIVSLLIHEFTDAAFIFGVLCLNALIGTYQEWKAEKSNQALQKLLQIQATVQRDGEVKEIDAEQIVPGDIVWLESGNRVPADMRLLAGHGLEIDESLLTGESLPVLKNSLWKGEASTEMGDHLNMAYAGSIVNRGRAKGLVIATGAQTNVGQLALDIIGEQAGKPPLIIRMEKFTHTIAITVLVASAIIGTIGVLSGRYEVMDTFLFAVALAVSAIPEGLPVAMTVALAIGTNRMAKRNVIVRRLSAVEGLGSCTLIATDKTGTLTCNELTVREVRIPNGNKYQISGEGFIPKGIITFQEKIIEPVSHPDMEAMIRCALLCNEADLHRRNNHWVWRGDTVDIALLALGEKFGLKKETLLDIYPQIDQIPFEAEHQFAASFNKFEGHFIGFVKGASEKIISMCSKFPDKTSSEQLVKIADDMAEQGYRVLALADKQFDSWSPEKENRSELHDLTFLGFVGMIDPLRPGVCDAVKSCQQSGVSVVMVTGDHPKTAYVIAQQLGLTNNENEVISGHEIMNQSDEELKNIFSRIRVFARVTPHQKLQIVEAAQAAGHCVAVTGDGVNDAPALRSANIGVAMGKSGTDVAREASDLVISDDNFTSILNGIEEGRIAYDNIRKVIYLLISTGGAELVLMGMAIIFGFPLPLLPVQLLWLNLVTNGIQDVALAFEPSEGNTLAKKPRPPNEPIFNRLMIERTIIGSVTMGVVAFTAFWWMLDSGMSETSARNALLLLMVLFENVHIGNCRSETKSAFQLSPFRSPILLFGTFAAFSLHVTMLYNPIGQMLLRTEPLDLNLWMILIVLALIILPVMEIHKYFRAK